jgi:GNAT superfamily N-acetyltransferase
MPRLLRLDDLPDLFALSASAGWNQTAEDWSHLLTLAPQSCYGIEQDGRIVSSATALVHSPQLAWIGMVLTLPEYRGRGFAKRLFEVALTAPASCFGLDATAQGQPLYEQYGFQPAYPVERWRRDPAPSPPVPSIPTLGSSPAHWESASLGPKGKAFARPGRIAEFFGPAEAADPEAAAQLLAWFLQRHGRFPCFWDLDPAQLDAVHLAHRAGFQPVRHLMRMFRGTPVPGRNPCEYALPGFEYGQ